MVPTPVDSVNGNSHGPPDDPPVMSQSIPNVRLATGGSVNTWSAQ